MHMEPSVQAEEIVSLICDSMGKVGKAYINVSVYNEPTSIRRERIYCYELYHQMRKEYDKRIRRSSLWKKLCINAEADKSGIRNYALGINPDFIIHQQGTIALNVCTVEVKVRMNSSAGIKKDFESISDMMHKLNYQTGVFVLVGSSLDEFINSIRRGRLVRERLKELVREGLNTDMVWVICQKDYQKIIEAVTVKQLLDRI